MGVLSRLGWRALDVLPVLLLVTVMVTALSDLLPGNPALAILGENATPERVDQVNDEYGFLLPLPERYLTWLGGAVTGDFGRSLVTGRPVLDEIVARLPVTLEITLLALVVSVSVSVPLATLAAAREGGRLDRALTALSSASMSVPNFVAAVFLVLIFAVTLGWLPVQGYAPLRAGLWENLQYMVLPVLAVSILELGFFFRILRGDLAMTLKEDFVLVARAKGLRSSYILFRHALRPSLFSLVTVVGLSFGRLLSGSVVVEAFFGLPGLGQLLVNSVNSVDLPVLQAGVVLIALFYILINNAVDVVYSIIDPRVKAVR